MAGRTWDATDYDKVGSPMTEMASAVVDRLILSGDETVLDAGCGTGRVSQILLERLPRGRVIAVDADPDMVRLAKTNLGLAGETPRSDGRVSVEQVDLLALRLSEPVEAVLSTATFHWVLDHRTLFRRLFDALTPGGQLVAQCGGEGNISMLRQVGEAVARDDRFAPYFEDWSAPWYYPGPDETIERLESAGFDNIEVWLQPWPVTPLNPAAYMSTVTYGAQVQRLPQNLREQYVAALLERLPEPLVVDYVRLNINAAKPD